MTRDFVGAADGARCVLPNRALVIARVVGDLMQLEYIRLLRRALSAMTLARLVIGVIAITSCTCFNCRVNLGKTPSIQCRASYLVILSIMPKKSEGTVELPRNNPSAG